MENELLTNKTAGALLRDAELELVNGITSHPVCLRSITKCAWDSYIGHDVTLPRNLAKAIAGRNRPFDTDQVHALEIAVEQHHGVKPPYYIAMSITLQQTGRPWAYIPKAGDYLTGFTLHKQ